MYRGFKITKETISGILQKPSYKNLYEREAKKIKMTIKKNLDKYFILDDKIDVEKLREDWFPTAEYDVFISHSHKDIEEIKALAGYLISEKNLRVFVDSFIWEYFEELQLKLDNKYNKQNNGTYNYSGSNWCSNNVIIILNSALQEVINNSEAIFFYNTPSSVPHSYEGQDRTESPWIFSEIETTRIIRRKPPKRPSPSLESVGMENMSATFSFWLDCNHLTTLDKVAFDKWIKPSFPPGIMIELLKVISSNKGENELDILYSIMPR
ncbi:MAG: hypothetical protein ACRC0S_09300 [Fusobacteriaceae bacterium]